MTNKRHDEVAVLFDAVIDLEPEARASFLETQCGSDVALRRAVEELLAAHADASGFLDPPMPAAAVSLLSQFSDAGMVGSTVGPYCLVEMIASGGMGTVFKAIRADDEQANTVAVKLIRHGMDTRDIVRRFHQERSTLAELRHPNIAAMLDGGVAANGQPYIVMEFVDGQPIDVHCDEATLGVRERLELMRTVCAAAQYAHQNLVVHRDLKPSNILVTMNGTPKLVDFGIAKLLGEGHGSVTQPVTATGFRLVTPQYASPEIVRGEPVTTAVDVYSLGLVLYELLTGRRPYDVQHKPPQEVLRLVCDVDPQVPSTVITQPFDVVVGDGTTRRVMPDHVSTSRRTSLLELSRMLRGDLDTVVLTAMHKDPKRRYASVEQLGQDIDRYLTGFPVRARKDSFAYRAVKFIRRNRVAAAASLVVALSLVIGMTAATVGLVSAQREAARARLEAAKANRISEFLQGMFAAVDPDIGSADVRVRDVLDQAATRLDVELANEPEVLASALSTIGQTYYSLGLHQQAEPLLRRSVSIYTESRGQRDPETTEVMVRLGSVLRTAGKLDEAREVLDRAIEIDTEILGRETQPVARALNELSGVQIDASDLQGAERSLREALAIDRKLYPGDHPDTSDTMERLGVMLAAAGRPAESESLCRDALAMNLRLFDEDHARLSHSRRRLAVVLQQVGRYEESEPLYRQALEADLKTLGGEHPNVARIQNNLGLLLVWTGRQEEGVEMLRHALALRRKLFGNEHLTVVSTLNNLATVLDVQRAEPLLRESLALCRNMFGPDHEQVGRVSQNLGACVRTLGDYDAAERLSRDAIRVLRANLGDHHVSLSYPLVGLGDVLIELNRPAEAEPYLREGVAIRRSLYSESHELVATAKNSLGHCLLRLGQLDEAKPLLITTGPQLLALVEDPEHERRRVAERMVELYLCLGDGEQAETYRVYLPLPDDLSGPMLLHSPYLPPVRPAIPRTVER